MFRSFSLKISNQFRTQQHVFFASGFVQIELSCVSKFCYGKLPVGIGLCNTTKFVQCIALYPRFNDIAEW